MDSGQVFRVVLLFTTLGIAFGAYYDAYEKSVLLDLCQYIGVRYVRNPDDRDCSYIECYSKSNHDMPCAPGLKMHHNFMWGNSYPCTEKDSYDTCSYFKKHLKALEKARKTGEDKDND